MNNGDTVLTHATVRIEGPYWNGNEEGGCRTAVRRTMPGAHSGPGIHGEPTDRQVRMHGVTQCCVCHSPFVGEYTAFNNLPVLQRRWFGR